MGSATITHPFHPLHGQSFAVLKLRRVSGGVSLSIRHPELGSFTIAEDWTDWGSPSEAANANLIVDAFGMAALAEMVEILSRPSKSD